LCLVLGAARLQPRRLLIVVAVAGVALGVAQAADRGDWPAAACLAGAAILAVGCPLLRAAAGRATEYAADAFAASCGYGPALAWALAHTVRGTDPTGWVHRL